MTAFPATNLNILTQAVAIDNTVGVVFNWNPGAGSAGEFVNYQFLDITIAPYDFTCGIPDHYCIQVPANVGTYVLEGLHPTTLYGWRVNSNFNISGQDQFVLSNPIQTTFTTANSNPIPVVFPANPMPPFPGVPPTALEGMLPPFPAILPYNTLSANLPTNILPGGSIIPNPAPPGTTFSREQVLNAIWQYTNLPGEPAARFGDALALVIATAGAESSYTTDACGDCSQGSLFPAGQALQCVRINDGRSQPCLGKLSCSWGLFQLNRCGGGQGTNMTLAQLTDPYVNSSVGVPPLMQFINSTGILNLRDYTIQQIANACAPAGHPGGSPDTSNLLTIDINTEYNRIKYLVRQTTFPVTTSPF